MSLQDHLHPGEQVLSQCQHFYATGQRIIRYEETRRGEVVKSVPYSQLRGIETVKEPRHNLLIMGTLAVPAGLALLYLRIIFFTSILVFLAAAALIYLGGAGKKAYYQIRVDGVPRNELKLWRVDFMQSGSFFATIRQIIGELPES